MIIELNELVNLQCNLENTIILDLKVGKYYGVTGLYKFIIDSLNNGKLTYDELKKNVINGYSINDLNSFFLKFDKIIYELKNKKIIKISNYYDNKK